jgi:DNA-3-methyladenine glycosylase I
MAKAVRRCAWAVSPAMIAYHDREWGEPVHDDAVLFEFLLLEGAQAGLSWSTILAKRERYRKLFAQFDPKRVARFSDAKVEKILGDAGIVRNRLKVRGAVRNAKAFLRVQREFGSFDAYVWGFVKGKPLRGGWTASSQVPVTTAVSDALSADLRARGFTFAGSTICYSFMQAVGMANDHLRSCFRYAQCR